MSLNAVAGAGLQALNHGAQFAVIEGGQGTTALTDHMVLMPLAQAIAMAVVHPMDALKQLMVDQQLHPPLGSPMAAHKM